MIVHHYQLFKNATLQGSPTAVPPPITRGTCSASAQQLQAPSSCTSCSHCRPVLHAAQGLLNHSNDQPCCSEALSST